MATDTPEHQTSALNAHAVPVAAGLRRSRRRWRVLAVMALIAAILALAGRFGLEQGAGQTQIARIEINGTIATDAARLAALERVADDESIKAVIISINSPGGTTAGGEELYEALAVLRAKKPVVAVIKELGASAAYMTAIGTDHIFARRLSIVGSIGVLFQHIDAGKLMDTIGINMDKVATGPLKAEPDINGPIKPEVRASITALVMDSYNWFVDIVAERRGLTRSQVLALADGRIITGRQGVETKLIDAIGGEAEAVAWLESEKGIAADLPIVTHYPVPEQGFDWLGQIFGSQARALLGLPVEGPIMLDGLVSLWQVGATL